MKSLKCFSLSVLVLSVGLFMSSCKKEKDTIKETCKIITVTPNSGNAFNFTYNSSGQIETVTTGNTVTVFSYSGNIILANTTVNGAFSTKKTITLNTNGFAATVKTETNANGSAWYKDTYDYNGTEIIKDTYTNSQNVVPEVTTVAWSGGNIISITQNSTTTTVEYYMDKPSQQGDYFQLNQIIQGYKVYTTKNAIKSALTNGNISSFDYTYEQGKIVAFKFNANGTLINYNYQYQCN